MKYNCHIPQQKITMLKNNIGLSLNVYQYEYNSRLRTCNNKTWYQEYYFQIDVNKMGSALFNLDTLPDNILPGLYVMFVQ